MADIEELLRQALQRQKDISGMVQGIPSGDTQSQYLMKQAQIREAQQQAGLSPLSSRAGREVAINDPRAFPQIVDYLARKSATTSGMEGESEAKTLLDIWKAAMKTGGGDIAKAAQESGAFETPDEKRIEALSKDYGELQKKVPKPGTGGAIEEGAQKRLNEWYEAEKAASTLFSPEKLNETISRLASRGLDVRELSGFLSRLKKGELEFKDVSAHSELFPEKQAPWLYTAQQRAQERLAGVRGAGGLTETESVPAVAMEHPKVINVAALSAEKPEYGKGSFSSVRESLAQLGLSSKMSDVNSIYQRAKADPAALENDLIGNYSQFYLDQLNEAKTSDQKRNMYYDAANYVTSLPEGANKRLLSAALSRISPKARPQLYEVAAPQKIRVK